MRGTLKKLLTIPQAFSRCDMNVKNCAPGGNYSEKTGALKKVNTGPLL